MEALFEIIISFFQHFASSHLELSVAHSLLFVLFPYYSAVMINPEGKSLFIKQASKAFCVCVCVYIYSCTYVCVSVNCILSESVFHSLFSPHH